MANSEAFFQSDACRTYNERMGATWAKCRAEFGKNRLIFSKRFNRAFGELERSLPHEYEALNESPDDLAAIHAKCFRDAHADLSQIALEDFGLTSEEEPATKNSVRA